MHTAEEQELERTIGEFAGHVDTVISQDSTIEEALQKLREKPIQQKIIYFYVVDDRHRLKGVVSTRQLLLSNPESKIAEVMQDWVAKLKVSQTLKDALELFDQHPLLALPVVDLEGKFIGAIDVQKLTKESVDLADLHNRAAVFQMIGLTIEDGKKNPLHKNYFLRMPWLLCNVFSGIICALISHVFEKVLMEFLILAFFIPLVLTLAESTSMQSMAQSLQLLRRPRFSWRVVWKKSLHEWRLVVLLALSSGLLLAGISMFWGGSYKSSLVIGTAILLSSVCSAFFGTLLPVVLSRMKLDPKVASGPLVLMIADMITIAIYLSIAAAWLL
jgi:magnesium transporter